MKALFSTISGILFVLAFVPYIHSIVKGPTKPAKTSWLIWASMDTVLFMGMLAKHTINGQIIGAICGAWIVFAFAMKYGVPGWTKIDKICLGGTIMAMLLWAISGNPVVGIVTSLGSGLLGSVPTFMSTWQDPSRENKLAWTLYFISCVFAVLAISDWTLASAGQPLVFAFIDTTVFLMIYLKPRR
ncbi:MAG: hypothetical protein WCV69_03400 [Patescibacteria group bacterium]|jgi:hypothetical protein